MNIKALHKVAKALVADGKGILAADESTATIKKRFDTIKLVSTENARRDYRQMLFTTPKVNQFISGVILYDETIRQKGSNGRALVSVLKNAGIIPGIKVDTGAKPLALHPEETVTEGLDGLAGRLVDYRKLGAKFAKWRAVYTIGKDMPSRACYVANAHALARYAALCQEAEIVPIVEPEVLMDGGHDIDTCQQTTEKALHTVFAALRDQDVALEGILLKPNMVLSGKGAKKQASVDEVAHRTIESFLRHVPAAVPGIVFLSGGQSDELATRHLNAMNKLYKNLPWRLSFSYGRALQTAPLRVWGGKAANVKKGQVAFYTVAKANGAATRGIYR
ncbi:MAG: class I fructose-bisphosphate aldolase [Alphaproteobacteria bacterium]